MNIRQQYYLFWVTAVAGVVLTALGVTFYFQQFGMKKYTDRDAGFSIRFPKDWAYASHKDGALAVFYTPAESDYDQFVENVNVTIHDISRNPMGMRDYASTAVKQMETIMGQQIEIIESVEMYVGGKRGHKFVFVGKGEPAIKMMILSGMKGEEVYQVTYTALTESFDFYLGTVQKMMNSFRIL